MLEDGWPSLLAFRSSRLVLFNECADLFHQFGDHGQGAGVNIQPVAFLVVKDGCVRTIQLSDGNNTVDRALTMIPELVEKVSALIKKDEPAAPKSEQ